jgi:hypothetical protein
MQFMNWFIQESDVLRGGFRSHYPREIRARAQQLSGSMHEDMYEIRQSIKRIRAALQIIRKDLSDKKYEDIDRNLHQPGKKLSRLREIHDEDQDLTIFSFEKDQMVRRRHSFRKRNAGRDNYVVKKYTS